MLPGMFRGLHYIIAEKKTLRLAAVIFIALVLILCGMHVGTDHHYANLVALLVAFFVSIAMIGFIETAQLPFERGGPTGGSRLLPRLEAAAPNRFVLRC